MRIEGLIDKRVCFECGSDKTYVTKRGYAQWRVKNDRLVCAKCFGKHRTRMGRNPEPIKRSNDKTNPRRGQRFLMFMGKYLLYPYQIRCGVCNWCRAVAGIDTLRTSLHHDENRYDESDPLRFTIELCIQCHGKEGARLKKAMCA